MRHETLWVETSTWTAYLTSIANWSDDSKDKAEDQLPHLKPLFASQSLHLLPLSPAVSPPLSLNKLPLCSQGPKESVDGDPGAQDQDPQALDWIPQTPDGTVMAVKGH